MTLHTPLRPLTPGHWHTQPNKSTIGIYSTHLGADHKGTTICIVPFQSPSARERAPATVAAILAIPKLIAACEAACAAIDSICEPEQRVDREYFDAERALLAEALDALKAQSPAGESKGPTDDE